MLPTPVPSRGKLPRPVLIFNYRSEGQRAEHRSPQHQKKRTIDSFRAFARSFPQDNRLNPIGFGKAAQHGTSMDLALLGNRALQVAVRRNLACFPSQAPIFGKRPRRDTQWRLAVLYFIRGWSTREIARRYGLTRERCGQIITDWRIRAVNMGYIQDITPEDFDAIALMAISCDPDADEAGENGRVSLSQMRLMPTK